MHLIRTIIKILTVIAFLIAAAYWAGTFIENGTENALGAFAGAVIFSFVFLGLLFIHLVLFIVHKKLKK